MFEWWVVPGVSATSSMGAGSYYWIGDLPPQNWGDDDDDEEEDDFMGVGI